MIVILNSFSRSGESLVCLFWQTSPFVKSSGSDQAHILYGVSGLEPGDLFLMLHLCVFQLARHFFHLLSIFLL